MSSSDVVWGDMNFRGLSDADIEALIAGEPVAGAPARLGELVGTLRSEFDVTPAVTVGMALGEFIDVVDVTVAQVSSGPGGTVGMAAKAAALFGAVSTKILLGAAVAVAAASVGGAHALGVIDVPGLPNRAANTEVDVPGPVQDAPSEDPARIEQDRFAPDGDSGLPAGSPGAADVIVEPSVPQAGTPDEPGDGCEFGQQTAEIGSDVAAQNRPTVAPTVASCDHDQPPPTVSPGQNPTDGQSPSPGVAPAVSEQVPPVHPTTVPPAPGEDPSAGPSGNVSPGRTPRGG